MDSDLADISIRMFRFPDDYPEVLNLWQAASPGVRVRRSDQPDEIRKKLQRDPDLFLVAELDGKIVGAVMGGFDGRRGLIYHLAVDPGFRQHGIGSLLMAQVEQKLCEKGCLRCYLLVTRDNPGALHFYQQLGWQTMDLFALGKDLDN